MIALDRSGGEATFVAQVVEEVLHETSNSPIPGAEARSVNMQGQGALRARYAIRPMGPVEWLPTWQDRFLEAHRSDSIALATSTNAITQTQIVTNKPRAETASWTVVKFVASTHLD